MNSLQEFADRAQSKLIAFDANDDCVGADCFPNFTALVQSMVRDVSENGLDIERCALVFTNGTRKDYDYAD